MDTEPDQQQGSGTPGTDPALDEAMKNLGNKDPKEMLKEIQGNTEEKKS